MSRKLRTKLFQEARRKIPKIFPILNNRRGHPQCKLNENQINAFKASEEAALEFSAGNGGTKDVTPEELMSIVKQVLTIKCGPNLPKDIADIVDALYVYILVKCLRHNYSRILIDAVNKQIYFV
jgi:hypothetical protein